MKAKEINDKSKDELEELLKSEKAKVVQLNFEISSRQLKNHAQLKQTRKTIARIKTRLQSLSTKQ